MFDKKITIPIACDHGGFETKNYLIDKLVSEGYQVKDFGTYGTDSVDYPDFIHEVASRINKGEYPLGIILCGSGNGAQMTANKYPNVRAGLAWNTELAQLARLHNNANILSIPGRFVDNAMAWEMINVFLNTDFEGGRHTKRVEKINQLK